MPAVLASYCQARFSGVQHCQSGQGSHQPKLHLGCGGVVGGGLEHVLLSRIVFCLSLKPSRGGVLFGTALLVCCTLVAHRTGLCTQLPWLTLLPACPWLTLLGFGVVFGFVHRHPLSLGVAAVSCLTTGQLFDV